MIGQRRGLDRRIKCGGFIERRRYFRWFFSDEDGFTSFGDA